MMPGTTRDGRSDIRLAHVFSTLAVGGPQVRFVRIANHFGDRYTHRLLAMDGRYTATGRLDSNVAWSVIDGVPRGGGLARLLHIRRMLAAEQPHALITYNWGAIEWAAANRLAPLCRHIHYEDGFGLEEAERQLARRVWLRRLALRGTHTQVLVPSHRLHDIAVRVWRLPAARVRLVPNGVDCRHFAMARDHPGACPFPRRDGATVIGTIATLRPEKNIARLLRVAARLARKHPVQLVIVGDGPARIPAEQLAADLGIDRFTIFTGAVADPALPLAHMDLFAISSDTEQMPLSVLEAMAAGLPICGTDVGDIGRMVAPENASFLVPPAHEAEFATALERLIADPAQRTAVGAANRARAFSTYDEETMFRTRSRLWDGCTH
mgnify:CR=1 FL=1